MNVNELIKANGTFHVDVIENGKVVSSITENNLVVTLGRQNIARLLSGHAEGKAIEKIAVGTNVIEPTLADSTITNAFVKAIEGATYPEINSVLFSFDIDNSEANGMTIREFGLLNSNNVLCARKVRAGEIIKTNAIRLVGTWKLTIN